MPISRNLSDLRGQLHYLRAHDREAERMAQRMQRLSRRLLSQRAVLSYVHALLTRYASLLRFEVRRHRRAVPLEEVDW